MVRFFLHVRVWVFDVHLIFRTDPADTAKDPGKVPLDKLYRAYLKHWRPVLVRSLGVLHAKHHKTWSSAYGEGVIWLSRSSPGIGLKAVARLSCVRPFRPRLVHRIAKSARPFPSMSLMMTCTKLPWRPACGTSSCTTQSRYTDTQENVSAGASEPVQRHAELLDWESVILHLGSFY